MRKIEINESQLQKCHQDILSIENHYQDIKAKQSKARCINQPCNRSFK